MKCRGFFVFKSLNKRDGGEFTNAQGEVVIYDDAYIIKVDEETENGIMERKFKFPTTNKALYDSLHELKPYTRIELEFEVSLYNNQVRLIPLYLVEE